MGCHPIYDDGFGNLRAGDCPWEGRGGYKGRLLNNSTPMKSEPVQKQSEEKFPKVISRSTKDTIVFYLPFGGNKCTYATTWCRKHCYLKNQPFNKELTQEIQKLDISKYRYQVGRQAFLKAIKDETYITFFSSGCIEDAFPECRLEFEFFIKETTSFFPNRQFRFYLRGGYVDHSFAKRDNATLILSIDNSTDKKIVEGGLQNSTINGISIIDHPDNEGLIMMLTEPKLRQFMPHEIKKVIRCEDCNGQMLCFKQSERFIVIQTYKDILKPEGETKCK